MTKKQTKEVEKAQAGVEVAGTSELWPIAKVKPYAKNAKNHPPEQITHLAMLLSRHGFDQPIVVDAKGVVIKGHGRLLAARELGMSEVPVIVRKLSKAHAAEARIADNKVADYGWNFDALVADVVGNLSEGLDPAVIGFSLEQLGLSEGGEPGAPATPDAIDAALGASAAFGSQYGVIVICESEDQQRDVFEALQADGHKCRVVVV